MYYVYILQNKTGRFYIGKTSSVEKRLMRHNQGEVFSTKPYRPWTLIFYEAYIRKSDADRREMYLKTAKGRTTIKTMLKDYLLYPFSI